MTHVTEHHTKEERERNYCKDSGISLKILGDTVRVYNLLVDISEFICLDVGWWRNSMVVISRDTDGIETR